VKQKYQSADRRCAITVRTYDDEDAEVMNVWTHPLDRGRGLATRLMAEVIADADREGKSLLLNVGPGRKPGQPGLSRDELEEWYDRLGFHIIGITSYVRMERPPGAPVTHRRQHDRS
jgi:ribosomal protein S18 acetylase RimI-like enzyme